MGHKKQPYEPPSIKRLAIGGNGAVAGLAVGTMGKNRLIDVRPAAPFVEPCDVESLLRDHGSPLFLISEGALRARYRAFVDTFTAAGIDTVVAYSYKTNYIPALCAILHEEGAWAELVSDMEYQLARTLGVTGERIILNGPWKRRADLERAIADGALINVDGFDELARIEATTEAMGRSARIGIRVNFRSGAAAWTRFGFSEENGESQQALERIARAPRLRLVAVHNHSGTFQMDPGIYDRAAAILIDVARRARKLGLQPTIADLGGGYPSGNRLKPVFDLPGGRDPGNDRLAPFAQAILRRITRAKDVFGGRPTVVLEPGRALVDATMRLACTVVATKDIPGQGRSIVIDAGVNILPTAYWYDHEVSALSNARNDAANNLAPVTLYGPLCMQIDVVRERALLPSLGVGDVLLIDHVGAYCLTQSMQFIQTRPAVVLLGPDGPELVRRRESWRDVFALDDVPERLRHPGHAL